MKVALMASKIQRLVSQAKATFSKRGVEPAFSEEMKLLKEVVSVWIAIYIIMTARDAALYVDYIILYIVWSIALLYSHYTQNPVRRIIKYMYITHVDLLDTP